MKKLYTLLFAAAASFGVNAQNVITNGSFETWAEGVPTGWLITLGNNGGSVTQETVIAQSGSSSVKLTAPAGTGNNRVGFTDFAVTPGTSYTISYWYNDQSTTARMRHWGSWRTATGVTATQSPTFQPDYNPDTAGWQQVTVSAVAPVDATVLRLDFRVFQETAPGGGSVYVDNVVAGVTGTLAVKENAIEGLKVYPNPVKGGNLFITSSSNETKSVAIYNVLGKQVLTANVNDAAVNVSNLSAGVYIVKITEAGKTATKKLIIE